MGERPGNRDRSIRGLCGRLLDRVMGEPPADDDRTPTQRGGFWPSVRAALFGQAVGFALSPLVRLLAAPLLFAGVVLLTVAWLHGPQAWYEASQRRAYSARIDGTIAESWIALDLDPAEIGDSLYWQRSARARPCMVVNAVGDWGPPVQRAFCGDLFSFDEETAAKLDRLAVGVPFAWRRDAHAIAMPELRLSDRSRDWFATKAADPSGLPSVDAPRTAFAALRLRMDRSLLDLAIAGWLRPAPVIALALDPAHPDDVLPAAYVDAGSAANPAVALIAAAMGLWFWWRGMAVLLGGLPRAPRWFATIAPMLLLPWWAGHVPEMVARISPQLAPIAAELLDDLTRGTSLRATEPARALLADAARFTFTVEQGDYARTFGWTMPPLPPQPPADADAALEAIAAGIAERVHALDPAAAATLFARLGGDATSERRAVGVAFLPAARAVLLDPGVDPAVADAARAFLQHWLFPPRPPNRQEPGYAARVRLHRALIDVPDARIADAARVLVARMSR